MLWDWSTHLGREGALRNLMISPQNIVPHTNDCWQALSTPKKMWTAKIAKKARLEGSGKTVIFLLFQRMLREYQRKIRPLGSYEDCRDSSEAMQYDQKMQGIWYAVADKYSHLLDVDAAPVTRKIRGRSATVIAGPWRARRADQQPPRRPVDRLDAREQSTEGKPEVPDRIGARDSSGSVARMSDCFTEVLDDILADIHRKSATMYEQERADMPRDYPVVGSYRGIVFRMAEKILGDQHDGKAIAIVNAQLALTRALLEGDAPITFNELIGKALTFLREAHFAPAERGTEMMYQYLTMMARETPWVGPCGDGHGDYYEFKHDKFVQLYKQHLSDRKKLPSTPTQ